MATGRTGWTILIRQAAARKPAGAGAEFVLALVQMYVLGDCTELMIKDFSIIEKTYHAHCITENGRWPAGDPDQQLLRREHPGICVGRGQRQHRQCGQHADDDLQLWQLCSDQADATVAVLSTTNFQGNGTVYQFSAVGRILSGFQYQWRRCWFGRGSSGTIIPFIGKHRQWRRVPSGQQFRHISPAGEHFRSIM